MATLDVRITDEDGEDLVTGLRGIRDAVERIAAALESIDQQMDYERGEVAGKVRDDGGLAHD